MCSVAFCSGCRPLAMALLSLNNGQVTGLFGRGSGIALLLGPWLPDPDELHAPSSEPRPAAPSIRPPAPAPVRRKLRRDTVETGGVPSACQPSLGCMMRPPFAQVARVIGALRWQGDLAAGTRAERHFNYS